MTAQLVVPETNDIILTQNQPQNPAMVYLSSLTTEPGRRTMHQALRTIAALLYPSSPDIFTVPWHLIRFRHTNALRTLLTQRYAPATANKMLAALRGTLRAAVQLGLMSSDDYYKAANIPPVKGHRLPAGRSVTRGELAALTDACADGTVAGVRDAAVIALLYTCGLRRAELVELTIGDYDPTAATLRVRGKGNKWRLVPVSAGAEQALQDWLDIRGNEPGPLFYSIRKGGHLTKQGMTTQAVYNILKHRAEIANVQTLSPHDLRRSFVSDLLDAGADIAIVQQLAGHANMATTARYDRRPEAAKRKAVSLLHFPYTKRAR